MGGGGGGEVRKITFRKLLAHAVRVIHSGVYAKDPAKTLVKLLLIPSYSGKIFNGILGGGGNTTWVRIKITFVDCA